MSLLREKTGNVSQFADAVVINGLSAGSVTTDLTDTGALSGGVVIIPADTPEMTIPLTGTSTTCIISLAATDITILLDPAYLFEGRILFGAQSGPGTIAFEQNEGTEVTIYDVTGRLVTQSEPTVFMGGYGVMVCTARTPTTATLRTISGNFGSTSLYVIPAAQTTDVLNLAGLKNVVSKTTSNINYIFDPATCCPFGSTLTITQSGSGQLTLVGQEETDVTFVDQLGAEITPVITQGMTCQYVSTAHTATSVTLQQVFCSVQAVP
jgi:hypothetical protein